MAEGCLYRDVLRVYVKVCFGNSQTAGPCGGENNQAELHEPIDLDVHPTW